MKTIRSRRDRKYGDEQMARGNLWAFKVTFIISKGREDELLRSLAETPRYYEDFPRAKKNRRTNAQFEMISKVKWLEQLMWLNRRIVVKLSSTNEWNQPAPTTPEQPSLTANVTQIPSSTLDTHSALIWYVSRGNRPLGLPNWKHSKKY